MEAVGWTEVLVRFLGAQTIPIVDRKRQHPVGQAVADVRAGVGDRVRVVVVAVQEDDSLHPHRRKADAEVLDHRHEGRNAQVNQASEADVRVAERVGQRRRDHRADRRRNTPGDLLRHQYVGGQG